MLYNIPKIGKYQICIVFLYLNCIPFKIEFLNELHLSGNCHNVLKNEIADESVDLIYIGHPFNSKRDYNIFFDSKEIQTQRIAFEDTLALTNIQDSLAELNKMQTHTLYKLLITYQEVAPHAFPYLVMMIT